MQRVRNAVIIIILCIIGAMTFKSQKPQLTLMPAPDQLMDAKASFDCYLKTSAMRISLGACRVRGDAASCLRCRAIQHCLLVRDVAAARRDQRAGHTGCILKTPRS